MLTIKQIAQELGYSTSHVYNALHRGDIKCTGRKLGKTVYFDEVNAAIILAYFRGKTSEVKYGAGQ